MKKKENKLKIHRIIFIKNSSCIKEDTKMPEFQARIYVTHFQTHHVQDLKKTTMFWLSTSIQKMAFHSK